MNPTLPSLSELRSVLRHCREIMPPDELDEIGIRSYVEGSALSRWAFWKKVKIIAELASVRTGDIALDFGCGTGILLPYLSSRADMVFATDLDLRPARFFTSRVGLKGVRFIEPSEWETAIPERQLSLAVCANVLEHVDDR